VLAFGCELAMLATFAVTGWQLVSSLLLQLVLAVALPLVVAGIWAIWMAPTSARRLTNPTRLIAEIGLFVISGAGLAAVGHPGWGLAVAAVSAVDFLVVAWRDLPRRPAAAPPPG
jgi:hypothetical protein